MFVFVYVWMFVREGERLEVEPHGYNKVVPVVEAK
jgi:hypothetical protein